MSVPKDSEIPADVRETFELEIYWAAFMSCVNSELEMKEKPPEKDDFVRRDGKGDYCRDDVGQAWLGFKLGWAEYRDSL